MTHGGSQETFDADLQWSHQAVQNVSRTFAITIDKLDEPTTDYICIGYLLCRIADTIEDAGHIPPDVQSELLGQYSLVLDPESDESVRDFRRAVDEWIPDERNADWEVVAQAPRVVHTFERLPSSARRALRDPVRELVDGMAEFVDRYADTGGLRIHTIEELEEYCWYAAGTVGTLITDLVARDASPEETRTMRETARSFALLLQLVNIAKDVADDYEEENNVYLPIEWLQAEGVDPEAITHPSNHAAVASVVQRVTGRAAGYLDDAQAYLEVVPETRGNRLAAWAIPYLLAVGTIRELRQRPTDVLRGGVKVSRAEVFSLIQRFESGVARDELGPLRDKISSGPYSY